MMAAAFILIHNVVAQEVKKSTEFSINLGYQFGLKDGSGGMFTLQPEIGRYFNEQFYMGIGTGVVANDKFNAFAIPAYLRAEVDFPLKSVTPYISFQGGYDFNIDGGGNGRIIPMFGVKVPITKNNFFNLGFGYMRTISKVGGFNGLGFNAGFSFNSPGHSLVKFFKSLDYTIELETFTPVKTTFKSNNDEYSTIYSKFIGLRFWGTKELPIKNLHAGIGVGLGIYDSKDRDKYKYNNEITEYSEICPYLNLMGRAQYDIKQFIIKDRIYPFAQIDLGMAAYFDVKFVINPAIGLSYIVNENSTLNISFGYAPLSIYNYDESTNKGSMRIALGYSF